MLTKQEFQEHLKWEFDTLVKVVAAVPADNFEFRAHEKSRSIKELVNSLIGEIYMTKGFLEGESITPETAGRYMSQKTESLKEAVEAMKTANQELYTVLDSISDKQLKTSVQFFHRTTTVDDAIFNMLVDIIHHRGQLSVFLRLAGGLVPSIYGPSADEEYKG